MVFRIFIGIVALLCAYMAFDSARIAWVVHSLSGQDDNIVITSESENMDVIEFLDYACKRCQDVHPILTRAVEQDGQIRYIVLPLKSGATEDDGKAAKLVYAAGRQGKFAEAHNQLIEKYRPIDSNYISNFALELGLDTSKLETDMADPELDKQLDKNYARLESLKGTVVPSILVNGRVLLNVTHEMPDSATLQSLFNRARQL